jgi:xylose isomerase
MSSSFFVGQTEYFKGIGKIRFEGSGSDNPLAYKIFNPEKRVGDKSMQEHLRFAVCYWHSFCGRGADAFGLPTRSQAWFDSAKRDVPEARMDAAFEFCSKLNVPYYCFHDVDFVEEAGSLLESEAQLQRMITLAQARQQASGVRLLWGIANLCTHPRFANGAATNPDFAVVARAAAQVQMSLDATHQLQGENFVFWHGRDGYASLLNSQMQRERKHLARLLSMTRDYARAIGFKGALLIEPKPVEPMRQHYDVDAATVIAFLREFDLHKDFKLNIEANHANLAGHSFVHDVQVCADAGMLGSLDINYGNPQNKWDTVQFPTRLQDNVELMLTLLRCGGLPHGGFNLDAKLRRESISAEDLFVAHIGAIDAFAAALEVAYALLHESPLEQWRRQRYRSFDSDIAARFCNGTLSLEHLHQLALSSGDPCPASGREEAFENLLNQHIYRTRAQRATEATV